MKMIYDCNHYWLTLLSEKHKDLMLKWRNKPEVRENMYNQDVIKTSTHNSWFENLMKDASKKYFVYSIDSKPVGIVGFTEINNEEKTANFVYYIGEETPKGSGQVLEQMSIILAFEFFKLQKLFCEVLNYNEKVIYIHKKYGFSEIETVKRKCTKDGKEFLADAKLLKMTSSDFRMRSGTFLEGAIPYNTCSWE